MAHPEPPLKTLTSAPSKAVSVALWSALVVGVALRVFQLHGQILSGDEWHAVHRAIDFGYLEIATSFGRNDYGIPIALYYKLALGTTGLTDAVVRLPFLASGILTLWWLPRLATGWVSAGPAALFAWFMALSPPLILYSRMARPYGIALLAAFLAVCVFERWWREGRRAHAVGYVLLSALAGYSLPVFLPFALSPFPYFLVCCLREGRPQALPRLLKLGAASAVLLGVLLAPPLIGGFHALASKAGRGEPLDGLAGGLVCLAGRAGIGPTLVLLGLAVLGWRRAASARPQLFRCLLLGAGLQIAAVIAARPLRSEQAAIVARYLLPALPLWLLLAACGVASVASRFGTRRREIFAGTGALVCTMLAALGPLPQVYHWPNNWIAQRLDVALKVGLEENARSVWRRPAFYQELGRQPAGSLLLVEAPSYLLNVNPMPVYQQLHRQRVVVGLAGGLCGKPIKGDLRAGTRGFQMKGHVFLADPDSLRARGAHYAVFHKDISGETSWPEWRLDVADCVRFYEARFGPASYQDRDLVVFDLRQPRPAPSP